ncbi:hypothetical protein TKK_0014566 [Trichogramma kaykai]
MRRENWTPGKWSKICAKHFTKNDYRTESEFGKNEKFHFLKKRVVPSIFPYNEKEKKKEKKAKWNKWLMKVVQETIADIVAEQALKNLIFQLITNIKCSEKENKNIMITITENEDVIPCETVSLCDNEFNPPTNIFDTNDSFVNEVEVSENVTNEDECETAVGEENCSDQQDHQSDNDSKKNQLSTVTRIKDSKVSSKRVHIERIIGLGKTFKILEDPLNTTQTLLAEEIIGVCCMLCNFRKNIVSGDA